MYFLFLTRNGATTKAQDSAPTAKTKTTTWHLSGRSFSLLFVCKQAGRTSWGFRIPVFLTKCGSELPENYQRAAGGSLAEKEGYGGHKQGLNILMYQNILGRNVAIFEIVVSSVALRLLQ